MFIFLKRLFYFPTDQKKFHKFEETWCCVFSIVKIASK